jgi:hypothetical protein
MAELFFMRRPTQRKKIFPARFQDEIMGFSGRDRRLNSDLVLASVGNLW